MSKREEEEGKKFFVCLFDGREEEERNFNDEFMR